MNWGDAVKEGDAIIDFLLFKASERIRVKGVRSWAEGLRKQGWPLERTLGLLRILHYETKS
jgi:hypothetical protein